MNDLTLSRLRESVRRFWYIPLIAATVLVTVSIILGQLGKGSISISSQPTGATIYLNTTEKGRTPTRISGLTPGSYQIKVQLEGYVLETRVVQIEASKEASLSLTLIREPSLEAVLEGKVKEPYLGSDRKLNYLLLESAQGRSLWSYDLETQEKSNLIALGRLAIDQVYWFSPTKALLTDLTGTAWLLSDGRINQLNIKGYGFSWSPDGSKLAYFNDRFFSLDNPEGLNIFDFDTGRVTNVIPDKTVVFRQSYWSPDGKYIAFQDQSDEGGGATFLVGSDGSGLIGIDLGKDTYGLSWSPDSSKILFQNDEGVWYYDISVKTRQRLYQRTGPPSLVSTWLNSQTVLAVESDLDGGKLLEINFSGEQKTIVESERLDSITDIVSRGKLVVVTSQDELLTLTLP